MMVEPDIEQAQWEDEARSNAPLYLKQIAYLFERSRFYREKLERAGFATHGAVGGLEAIEGVPVKYDVAADFAVLCSNCHRMIHRFTNPSDLASFRAAINK